MEVPTVPRTPLVPNSCPMPPPTRRSFKKLRTETYVMRPPPWWVVAVPARAYVGVVVFGLIGTVVMLAATLLFFVGYTGVQEKPLNPPEHREFGAGLPPGGEETLRNFWRTVLHLLSFLNFDRARVRDLFLRAMPACPSGEV